MSLLRILFAAIMFLVPYVATRAALPDRYKFSLLDINSGLSHNQITCFLKDSKGYVWIGTQGGLNRYDGYQITTFRHDSKDSTSIHDNEVQNLYEGPDGYIWVSTYKGLSIYNPKTETFTSGNLAAFLKQYGLQEGTVQSIFKDKQGHFWFIQAGQGLVRYSPKSRKVTKLRHTVGINSSLSSNSVSVMGQNGQGDYWVLHQNGLLEKLSASSLKVVERVNALVDAHQKTAENFTLTIDSDNDLWISTFNRNNGVYLYRTASKILSNFNKSTPDLRLKSNVVGGVVEAEPGQVWVITDHGGINIIHKSTMQVSYVLSSSVEENALVDNSLKAVYKDREGIIWLGTYKKGVNIYHKDMFRFNHYKHQPAVAGSLPYDDVNRFAEDEKGNLWIGTNGGGLLYLDRKTGKYTRYASDPNNPNSIGSDVIVSLLLDRNKDLWIGTYTGGLSKFDGEKFTRIKGNGANSEGLADDNIWEIFEDSDGVLWVGTLGQGLYQYDRVSGTFRQYKLGENEAGSQLSYISAIAEDANKNIWVGGNNGIAVLDKRTGKTMRYRSNPKDSKTLASNNILYIHTDSRKNTWIATSEGLHLYQPKDKSFRLFTQKDGLPHNIVLTILEDDEHNLWVSTPNGVSTVVPQLDAAGKLQVSFRNYDITDGLQGKVFNENAAFKTAKGELIFGGPNGFNVFSPEDLGKDNTKPQLIFTDFQLFNKSLKVGEVRDDRVVLAKALSEGPHIELKHDEDVLTIGFAALSFIHPDRIRYKYKLEGFDKDWHETSPGTRQATYTNLDPGDYEFRVVASNSDGVWSEEGISMKLTVLAPFWRTTTAYVLYVLLSLGLLYSVREFELRRNRRKFLREQEKREVQQMQELNQVKIRFFTNISHEFRTPLALILAPLEKLLKSTSDAEQLKQFEMMNRNSKRLLNLVNQLLDFRKLEVEEAQLHLSEGNVIKFLQTSVQSFSDLSEKKNISLSFQADANSWYTSFDMDKLEKVLFNLLSNAFKFTNEGGKVDVTVKVLQTEAVAEGMKMLELKVQDTGIGIAKDEQEKVFERFFRSDLPTSLVNQGSGIGLAITSEFVKIHGGQISLESELGIGSCFTVRIPMKEIAPVAVVEAHVTESVVPVEDVACLEEVELSVKEKVLKKPVKEKPVLLLVEDNEDFLAYLKDNLEVHFDVLEAPNGKEGWQKALANMPDLIISDLMMPVLDGLEFCKKVKGDSRTSHIPFLLLSAHTAEEQKLRGLNIGANDYITKPFSFELLLSRVNNLVTQNQLLHKALEKKISVQTSQEEIVSLDDKLIQRAIKLVEENLSNPDFSVEYMSKELAISRVHLYKKMVSLTGTSPVEFIRKIRLQHAARLLEKSQLTVSEVAYKVGFNNRKYFTKYFKEEYQVLPSAYAESVRQYEEEIS
ncbi:two-component regulator propeller domain-containing protein [Pontibacter korlensis]|nr:two-component regulator propeller domain-containing protein [Pontibacter korlensis]